jgi:lipopolysaccharide export system protein LptA
MRRRPDLAGLALALVVFAGMARAQASAEPAAGAPAPPARPSGGPLGFGGLGKSKEPITVISDNLEYDYKRNVVVYRGSVQVTQGDLKLVSDTLTITLQNDKQDGKPEPKPAPAAGGADNGRVQEIVALGNVRIDQGQRWAVGGRAVFDQGQRTLTLTQDPVLHDGQSEVAGDRVVVFLDEDRSVVEGGQKRVKAVLYPNEKPGAPQPAAKPAAAAPKARAAKGRR